MASNALSSRLEELRSPNPQSPPSERAYSGYNTPTRYSGNFSNMHSSSNSQPVSSSSSSSDPRNSNMQRRFTADSNTFPTPLSPVGYQNMEAAADVNSYHRAQAQLNKKRDELETLREQKKRIAEEFMRINNKEQEKQSEVEMLSKDSHSINFSPGHQSEPTTPPEYRDQSYNTPSIFNSRNRYSSASLISVPGLNRISRSGSQVHSPPNELVHPNGEADKFTSRNNRYSMPVTLSARQKRESVPDFPAMGLTQIDTTSILFGDDDDGHDEVTSPAVKSYLQAHTTEDKFPVLLRSNHKPGTLSASSAALDLANVQAGFQEAALESKSNGWPTTFNRNRQSLTALPQSNKDNRNSLHSASSSMQSVETVVESPALKRQSNRHSMEATLAALSGQTKFVQLNGNATTSARPNLANLPSSYSANDIPTVKAGGKEPNTLLTSANSSSNDHAFHKHNVSLGRVPTSIMGNRLSRDLVTGEILSDEPPSSAKIPTTSATDGQAGIHAFGTTTPTGTNSIEGAPFNPSAGLPSYDGQNFYPYMSNLNMNMNQMNLGPMNSNAYMNGMQFYSQQQQQQQSQMQSFSNYNQYNAGARFGGDNQQKSNQPQQQQRRATNTEGHRRGSRRSSNAYSDPDSAKFSNAKIENYTGEIYTLCKDQHGCRYLQKQLETRHPETVQLIFSETAPHVIELMTDPFGNYLCQKLLEHTNDAQRTVLVENAAPHMVQIALNQHGTRALQKMIEHLSTDEQISIVRNALKDKVVDLIQDLNGNHVIQKCLNRLTSEESQFIFDAVGKNCVVVGTHRHGCCVLQRCIDHASGHQKADLIAQITANAFRLIQDPYGNYVLQYILDLGDTNFTDPLCYSFQSRIVELSKHKFSSNVIEKCIRHAAPNVANMMIEEMLGSSDMERMLRDSFANYVVQTALDYAQPETRTRLIDTIRPILPSIRHTPHGRRIQQKVLQSDSSSHNPSPSMSPSPGAPQIRGPGPMNRNGSGSHHPFYNQQAPTNYGMNGFNAQQGFAQTGGAGTNGQRLGSAGNYPQYNPMSPQNGMHQGLHQAMPPSFNRGTPQTTGYNFF